MENVTIDAALGGGAPATSRAATREVAREAAPSFGVTAIALLTVLCAVGIILLWLIVTRSLPIALAKVSLPWALFIAPDHPDVVMARTMALRVELRDQSSTRLGQSRSAAQAPRAQASKAKDEGSEAEPESAEERAARLEAIRDQLRQLARRLVVVDPLNATAYRLLGETSDESDQTRRWMLEATKRSRREPVALFWLLNDSVTRKDNVAAVSYAEALLRAHPQLTNHVLSYVNFLTQDPQARSLIVAALASDPPWRKAFFEAQRRVPAAPAVQLALLSELAATARPPRQSETAPLQEAMIERGDAEQAYNFWLQRLPKARLSSVGFLINPAFDEIPSGAPFDWRIAPPPPGHSGSNVSVDFVPASDGLRDFRLQVAFPGGRARFPDVTQIVLLGEGRYRLSGVGGGALTARRGLRWQVRCIYEKAPVLGQTDPIMGGPDLQFSFTFDFLVPSDTACRAQQVRLFHDARSTSEQLATGELWFDKLSIERIAPE